MLRKRATLVLTGLGLVLAGAYLFVGSARKKSHSSPPAPKLEFGREYPPPNEDQAIEKIRSMVADIVRSDYPRENRPARRDAHPKHHGCARAEFRVEDVPEDLKAGVFREPRVFKAWIRFSNSASTPGPDIDGDGRGMAIKLTGVQGDKLLDAERSATTQDFVMISHPVFFIPDAGTYVDFVEKQKGHDAASFFLGFRNPSSWHLRLLKIAQDITALKIGSPLEARYYSMTPYKLGDRAIKFSARPCSSSQTPIPSNPADDYLRDVMARQLHAGAGCFEFLVQRHTDPDRTPIEDPTIEWQEKESPFVKIASIHIASQTFASEAQMTFCENLSYTPWHALPEHRPLGGINRVRRVVYSAISELRHELNDAPRQEPNGDESF